MVISCRKASLRKGEEQIIITIDRVPSENVHAMHLLCKTLGESCAPPKGYTFWLGAYPFKVVASVFDAQSGTYTMSIRIERFLKARRILRNKQEEKIHCAVPLDTIVEHFFAARSGA